MGRLWDSLDPAASAPITPALAAELDRREADVAPEAGTPWAGVQADLRKTLRQVSPVRVRATARTEIAEAFNWYLARSPQAVAEIIAS
jgi:putative addiction module component (TIGR02574 family)